MNRTTRTILVATALLAAVATAVPSASAGELIEDDGTKLCKRAAGINACVAINYGDCDVWVSASFGGCFAVPDET